MAIYGGFAPGNYNAWAMNLVADVFCTPGVGRGLQVTAPGGMSVTVGVDAVALDGVVMLPNGGWVRIDQAITFTVPANSSGSTRNDAVVAFLDPTGVANPVYSLTYNANWAGGFTGNSSNQWVVATISVPNGAVSIAGSNITMNPRVASFGGNKVLDSNTGIGVIVTDFTASHNTHISTTASTPDHRSLVLTAQDSFGAVWDYKFDYQGIANFPTSLVAQGGGSYLNSVNLGPATSNYANLSLDTIGHFFNLWTPSFSGIPYSLDLHTWDGSSNHTWHVDPTGNMTVNGNAYVNAGLFVNNGVYSVVLAGSGPTNMRIFTGSTPPTNATNGDIWINA